jgi:hypothetical protein
MRKGVVIIGTKGCYGFHRDGVDKLTYNHFDSYPEGLGADIVEFVRQTSVEEMNQIFDRIQMVDEDKMATPDQVAECYKWYNGAVSTGQPTEWYALLRNAQGDLNAFKEGLRYMIDSSSFMEDSLCEWAYVINLTTNRLEIYKGHCNVKLVIEFPLDDIPENWLEIVGTVYGDED